MKDIDVLEKQVRQLMTVIDHYGCLETYERRSSGATVIDDELMLRWTVGKWVFEVITYFAADGYQRVEMSMERELWWRFTPKRYEQKISEASHPIEVGLLLNWAEERYSQAVEERDFSEKRNGLDSLDGMIKMIRGG